DFDLEKAQLDLGHGYNRAEMKFNVNRVDNMVIQAIFLLDMLNKDINSFSMRVSPSNQLWNPNGQAFGWKVQQRELRKRSGHREESSVLGRQGALRLSMARTSFKMEHDLSKFGYFSRWRSVAKYSNHHGKERPICEKSRYRSANSFERKDLERELLAKLLVYLCTAQEHLLSQRQLLQG
ncbi:hypothetical protein ACJX0J_034938, partial [Zea mays]